MIKCGLLGRKLGHSWSPQIHGLLADYEYALYEREEEQLEDFLLNGGLHGMNVTIPYKKTVMPYCAQLSPLAAAIGSVNTIVRRPDGSLYGDNTDAYGFESLLNKAGIDPRGKKCLVLGSGGTSVTAQAVLKKLGAGEVKVISRSGEDNYNNLSRHYDAHIIVNTTPVGMYPDNGAAPLDLAPFGGLCGVVDVVYNPQRTALILQAERMGISCVGGLHMLVAQAKRAAELFTDSKIDDSLIDSIEKQLSLQLGNIVLVGMPGCGKSTVAKLLGEKLRRPVYECDAIVAEEAGMTIEEIFAQYGQEDFRRRETGVLRRLGKLSGAVISTGGGCVTPEENFAPLRQNGTVVWLQRAIDGLDREGRPLSKGADLHAMYALRSPMYRRFSHFAADNNGAAEDTVTQILEGLK